MAAPVGLKGAFRTLLTYNGKNAIDEDELGVLRYELDHLTHGIRVYRFVEVDANAANAVSNGTVLTFVDKYNRVVTDDISASHQNKVAGVGIGNGISKGNRGWIQVGGYHPAVKTNGDDDIAVGMQLIVDGTTDGTCNSMAIGTAATHAVLGVAVSADVDADNTVEAYLCCK